MSNESPASSQADSPAVAFELPGSYSPEPVPVPLRTSTPFPAALPQTSPEYNHGPLDPLPLPPDEVAVTSPAVALEVAPAPAVYSPIRPARMLDDPNHQAPPLSPRSAASIVEGDLHNNNTILLVNIIRSLVATIKKREEEHVAAVKTFDDTLDSLQSKVLQYEETFSTPPDGYVENNGHYPTLEIRLPHGQRRPAKWIKQLDNYCVAALCDRDVGSSTPSIFDVYASPNHSDRPVQPLPDWLIDLLTADASTYTLVQDAATELDDWGLAADLDRFRRAHAKLVDLYKQVDSYASQAECTLQEKAAIQSQLELAKVGYQLHHLKGLSDNRNASRGRSAWKSMGDARGRAM